jgi:hypothetical protein
MLNVVEGARQETDDAAYGVSRLGASKHKLLQVIVLDTTSAEHNDDDVFCLGEPLPECDLVGYVEKFVVHVLFEGYYTFTFDYEIP